MNTANNAAKNKIRKAELRKKRSRAKISGTAARPRMSIFKSTRHILVQLIDDTNHKTLASASDCAIKLFTPKDLKDNKKNDKSAVTAKCRLAFETGREIAQKAKKINITDVVFDRSGYKYHGRVKSLADGARSEGLKF